MKLIDGGMIDAMIALGFPCVVGIIAWIVIAAIQERPRK